MTRRLIALAGVAAIFSACAPISAKTDDAGSTFVVPVTSSQSARTIFREAYGKIGAQLFVTGVHLTKAVADRKDRFVQGSFEATDHGTPVAGVLIAIAPNIAGIAVDRRDRIAKSLPALTRRLAQQFPRQTAAARLPNVPLHTVDFGSGTIALPDGWKVLNSFQGCVEAGSERVESYLALGCPANVAVSPGLPGNDPRTHLTVPYGSPTETLTRFLKYPQPAGLGFQSVHVIETQPVSGVAGAQSAYVLFDYRIKGVPFRGFALSSVMPIDNLQFVYYKSMFLTPGAKFSKLAPTLWRSWQSWGVSNKVLNDRLTSAAQSMREAGDILTGAYWARQQAGARSSLAFDQYIRDVETVENTTNGKRKELGYFAGDALVAHDPATYRIVPTAELITR
ncbi:MAG: hypothetical protein GIW95_03665 [Candidatus Eremiobacteraeota bacterium]|nr:hypothetical protein [Candidatus Eremiobacteraeota bacterium]